MKKFGAFIAAATMAVVAPVARAATVVVAFDEAAGLGREGDPGNTVITRYLGAAARVTGIAYSATITSFGTNWLVDQNVRFGTIDASLVNLQPGFDSFYTGTETFDGAADLVAYGLDFLLEEDGILRIEFYDSWNTGPEVMGRWTDGRFTISYDAAAGGVPEPATWTMLMLGMGAIGYSLRRRGTYLAGAA